jgi:hypothetical protein
MTPEAFRTRILESILAALKAHPDAFVHLVYAPELSDPLELVEDARRDVARLTPQMAGAMPRWPVEAKPEAQPRLVTLDVRRVASYLEATHPALDDPLLEASISRAYAESFEGAGVDSLVTHDAPGLAERAVCGWIVGTQEAGGLSQRLKAQSAALRQAESPSAPFVPASPAERWVRWYRPENITTLWPLLDAQQQEALLGGAVWLSLDATRHLKELKAAPSLGVASARGYPVLKMAQWQALDNVRVVTQLTRQWADWCAGHDRALPADASQRLHRYVQAGRDLGIDGDDLAVYALLGVRLAPGALDDPQLKRLTASALACDAGMRSVLDALPEAFWATYAQDLAPRSPAAGGHD